MCRVLKCNSLREMLVKCMENNYIVKCNKLASYESIHYSNGYFYYEDGCVLGNGFIGALRYLEDMKWTKDAEWYIAYQLSEEEVEELKRIHKSCHGLTINFESKFKEFIKELEDKHGHE